MSIGLCQLCGKTEPLQDSHYIPRAFYKLLKTPGAKNSNPVVATPKVKMATSDQFKGYLLCRGCEDRFNKNGEAWVLKNCWRTYSAFPLADRLSAAAPLFSDGRSGLWAGGSIAGVDPDKLTYFAASMFWRGTLKGWRSLAGHVPPRLELGPYAEGLRLFLLGERAFPADVLLITMVSAYRNVVPHRDVIAPFRKGRDLNTRCYLYRFRVLGITFDLFAGKGIPVGVRALCTVRSRERLIHSSADVDDETFADLLNLHAKGRAVGKIASP